jgi:hypothetical protein
MDLTSQQQQQRRRQQHPVQRQLHPSQPRQLQLYQLLLSL